MRSLFTSLLLFIFVCGTIGAVNKYVALSLLCLTLYIIWSLFEEEKGRGKK